MEMMRLRPEFLSGLDRGKAQRNHVTYSRFAAWCESNQGGLVANSPHLWSPLWRGESVPAEYVRRFHGFLHSRKVALERSLDDIADVGPGSVEKREAPLPSLCNGWETFYAFMGKLLDLENVIPAESMCMNRADIEAAARIVMIDLAVRRGGTLKGDRAVEACERIVKRSLGDVADAFELIWLNNRHCVQFSILRGRRVGASAIIPVTEEYFNRFLAGGLHEVDVTPDDLLPVSRFLLIVTAAENREFNRRRDRYDRGLRVMLTLLFQMAGATPPPMKHAPRILSFMACPEALRKLRAYGFQPVGTENAAGMGLMQVGVAVPDGRIDAMKSIAQYAMLRGLLHIIQAAQRFWKEVRQLN